MFKLADMSDHCCHTPVHEEHGQDHDHLSHRNHNSFLSSWVPLVLALVSMATGMPHFFHLQPSFLTALISMLISFAVVFIWGRRFLTAIPKLFRSADMNTLVGLGIVASFVLSFWNWSHGNVEALYFDSAAMVAALVLFGQSIENFIREKMNAQMSRLAELLPSYAHQIVGDSEEEKNISDLRSKDVIRVRPGERVPVDGKLLSFEAVFDESILSGESKPVERAAGYVVMQGALNAGGPIEMEVLRVSQESFYSQMVKSVRESLAQKPRLQKQIDKIATVFVPLVVLIAVGAFFYWQNFSPGTDLFVRTSISVLVIACPCALGLATPAALLVGVLRAGKKGILIRSLDSVEAASDVSIVAFDKTGTLTVGKPSVVRVQTITNVSHKDLLQLASSVEVGSEHPYAEAIRDKAEEEKISNLSCGDRRLVGGKGVSGKLSVGNKEQLVCVGNLVWLYENGYDSTAVPADLLWEAEGTDATVLWVGSDRKILGVLFLSDALRPEARVALEELSDAGYSVGMITGDAENVARSVAKNLKLKFFHAGVLPQEKATIVKRLSEPKKKGLDVVNEKVAFVGDGINDGPALAEAHLGLAMGGGTALAQSTADLVLLSNNIAQVPLAFKILKQTKSLVTRNLVLSSLYNLVAIPVAAGVLYPQWGFLLSPSIAAAAMALSSITVLLNSLWALRR